MTSLSFSTATKTSFQVPVRTVEAASAPYDNNLRYDKIIDFHKNYKKGRNGKPLPDTPVRSINANLFLRDLDKDNLKNMEKITLACQYTRNGPATWDVIFNEEGVNRRGFTACLFTATDQYTPLSKDRVIVTSSFLNLAKSTSRTHFNKIEQDDKIGITIHSTIDRITYVLLYTISSFCLVKKPKGDNNSNSNNTGDEYAYLNAMNCDLDQIYRVEPSGAAEVVEVREIEGNPDIFVSWMVNAVRDVTNAFAFKPHFTPQEVSSFNREVIEARLKEAHEEVQVSSYAEFEEACRDAYRVEMVKKRAHSDDKKNPAPKLPVVEVAKFNDAYLAKVNDQYFYFLETSLHEAAEVEKYFTNSDIEGKDLVEVPYTLVLSEGVFGKDATLRYFTANF